MVDYTPMQSGSTNLITFESATALSHVGISGMVRPPSKEHANYSRYCYLPITQQLLLDKNFLLERMKKGSEAIR